jgi:hypothetical protein
MPTQQRTIDRQQRRHSRRERRRFLGTLQIHHAAKPRRTRLRDYIPAEGEIFTPRVPTPSERNTRRRRRMAIRARARRAARHACNVTEIRDYRRRSSSPPIDLSWQMRYDRKGRPRRNPWSWRARPRPLKHRADLTGWHRSREEWQPPRLLRPLLARRFWLAVRRWASSVTWPIWQLQFSATLTDPINLLGGAARVTG